MAVQDLPVGAVQHLPVTIQKKAVELVQRREKLSNLSVGYVEVDSIPSTHTTLYRIDVFQTEQPNDARYSVVLDDAGKEVDLVVLSKQEHKQFFAPPPLVVSKLPAAARTTPITVTPAENVLVLNLDDTFNETITVTVPLDAAVPKVDVYFLADSTSSMRHILGAVKTGATNILTSLNGLGVDMAFGVGNYRDFPRDIFAFQHQQDLTTVMGDVSNAINAWVTGGGGDAPEGQLFALDQLAQPAGGSIGWRSDAKRILVWFGDAPGHDPVCSAISGLPYAITEASVTGKLVSEAIAVLAISTNTGVLGSLDGNPVGGDYTASCGTPAGSAGQASRIAAATGGTHVVGINASTIVNTIIDWVSTLVSSINNVSLVPSGGITPFVASITPVGGYGPLSGDEAHVLAFQVQFKGIELCGSWDQIFRGTLDVVADGVIVARKRVRITVPACKRLYSYSVKFVCGIQKPQEEGCPAGVLPGMYATEINIHNYQDKRVRIEKFLLPLIVSGKPEGREPRLVKADLRDVLVMPGNTATMDDCCRLAELLKLSPNQMAVTVGFLEIVSPIELQITAVYTATDMKSQAVSIDVEQVVGKLKKDKTLSISPPNGDLSAVASTNINSYGINDEGIK